MMVVIHHTVNVGQTKWSGLHLTMHRTIGLTK